MKETEERSIEIECNTQMNIKKGRMTEKDKRGIQKGRKKKVLFFICFNLLCFDFYKEKHGCVLNQGTEKNTEDTEMRKRGDTKKEIIM